MAPKNWIILFLFTLSHYSIYGQKNYFPTWTYHQKNINIHGISVGIATISNDSSNTNTNGIKIELIGLGILVPLVPRSPVINNDSMYINHKEFLSEKINGLSLSTSRTVCDCITNGISMGMIGQINFHVNGFSASLHMNFTQKSNGIQMSLMNESHYLKGIQLGGTNMSTKTKGLQIGLLNSSKELRGLQIGIWNVNQKRKLPIINWNFKRLS
ncbi:MAG: hypothetical protein H6586_04365 [Flavobacteriales bacterium]|nr:hypothetical protein [Flavobacteriales bacterium]